MGSDGRSLTPQRYAGGQPSTARRQEAESVRNRLRARLEEIDDRLLQLFGEMELTIRQTEPSRLAETRTTVKKPRKLARKTKDVIMAVEPSSVGSGVV